MRSISGVRGQSPCHHTRQRSGPRIFFAHQVAISALPRVGLVQLAAACALPALQPPFCERVEPVHQTINLIAVLVTTLLTGNELAIGAFVHPVISKLDDAAHAAAAKPLARVLGKVMPVWYAGAILVVVVALLTRVVGSFSWWACLTSAVLLAVTVPFTLICLVPLNNRVAALDLNALPGDWKNDRRRWDQYHGIRIAILMVASVAMIVAAI